ncbi:MAG: TrbC/VirB2 family protein [Clostridia bacterium]
MKNKIDSKNILKKIIFVLLCGVMLSIVQANNVFATEDPLSVINNLQTFISGLVKGVGVIILILGIVQIGMSLKSHDPSQRANGIMTLAGGVVIAFAPQIVTLITGG